MVTLPVSGFSATVWADGWNFPSETWGLSFSWTYIAGRSIDGVAAGGFVVAEKLDGVSMALAYNFIDEVKGMAVGGYNKSDSVTSIQIGLLNGTRQLNGIQIGLLNWADNNPVPLKIFPLFNGRLSF